MSDQFVDSTVTTPPVSAEESSSLLTPAESKPETAPDLPSLQQLRDRLQAKREMLLARTARHAESEAMVKANPQVLETINDRMRRKPKALSDKKMYKRALAIIALRAQGLSAEDVATTLGVTKQLVRSNLYYANKKGWLTIDTFADPNDQLEYVLQSKAVRNINALLDGDVDFKGDKETTLEVAKGLGLLKQHQVVKPSEAVTNVGLKVEVIMPSTTGSPDVRAGSIGGAPIAEAEVLSE